MKCILCIKFALFKTFLFDSLVMVTKSTEACSCVSVNE